MIHAKRSDGIITVCRRKCGFLSHVVKQFGAVVCRVRLVCVVGYFGEISGGWGGGEVEGSVETHVRNVFEE